jgi:hypothetical protein
MRELIERLEEAKTYTLGQLVSHGVVTALQLAFILEYEVQGEDEEDQRRALSLADGLFRDMEREDQDEWKAQFGSSPERMDPVKSRKKLKAYLKRHGVKPATSNRSKI